MLRTLRLNKMKHDRYVERQEEILLSQGKVIQKLFAKKTNSPQ